MRLKDKVVIITGSGQGLGKAVALRFINEGAKVVIAEINEEAAQQTVKEIEGMGGEALAIKSDVSSEESTNEMAKKTAEKFGKIDVLINNAAIYYGIAPRPFHQWTVKDWDLLMSVNVKGAWLCSKAVFPYMQKQEKGKIINVSSSTYFMGSPMYLHYVTSKGAVVGMTRGLARELGEHNITVNAIAPGFAMTESTEVFLKASPAGLHEGVVGAQAFKRPMDPNDLPGGMVFLASDDSDFITGQTICVDGGLITW
jgi:3-oxoacyl-[acyl-carrier protein] reductase